MYQATYAPSKLQTITLDEKVWEKGWQFVHLPSPSTKSPFQCLEVEGPGFA